VREHLSAPSQKKRHRLNAVSFLSSHSHQPGTGGARLALALASLAPYRGTRGKKKLKRGAQRERSRSAAQRLHPRAAILYPPPPPPCPQLLSVVPLCALSGPARLQAGAGNHRSFSSYRWATLPEGSHTAPFGSTAVSPRAFCHPCCIVSPDAPAPPGGGGQGRGPLPRLPPPVPSNAHWTEGRMLATGESPGVCRGFRGEKGGHNAAPQDAGCRGAPIPLPFEATSPRECSFGAARSSLSAIHWGRQLRKAGLQFASC